MEVVPVSVGVASRAWDEQHLEVAGAARQVDGAATDGFTESVSGTASRFTGTWARFVRELGTDCESCADGLRVAIREYVGSDELTFHELIALGWHLTQVR